MKTRTKDSEAIECKSGSYIARDQLRASVLRSFAESLARRESCDMQAYDGQIAHRDVEICAPAA